MLQSSSRVSGCASPWPWVKAAGARLFLLLAVVFLVSSGLHAQNYSWDARSVGMGGETGLGEGNLAAGMVPPDRSYTSIVIPLGFVQVFSNLQVFDPNDPGFDALRAIDYVGNPFHYSFNRSEKTGSVDFLKNIVDSGFSRDLNTYRGFAPPEHMVAGGVLAPNWGYTFKFHRGANESFQGIYLGAGPYISLQSDLRFDPRLVSILGSAVDVTIPANTTFFATNSSSQQAAAAITGGYRAKIGFPGGTSARDGVYLAVNFNYLIGLRQDAADLNLQIDTDGAGLVTATPLSVPLTIDHLYSTSGRGFSTDVGVAVVKNGWEFGVGANDIANRIDWRNHHDKLYSLTSLTTGVGFVTTSPAAPTGIIRKELPVQYVSNVGYSAGRWTVRTDWAYQLQKLAAHAGGEYRVGPVALRGGARYGLKEWNPTGGIGLNFTHRFGIDVGLFGNSTNLEQRRNLAVAVSFRIEHPTEK
jgi:hypothetical protein